MYQVCIENCSEDYYDLMEQKLKAMTFWAHKAVLFEKIKQKIEEQEGEKLDKIANLLIENSKEEIKNEKENEEKKQELKKHLKEAFEN